AVTPGRQAGFGIAIVLLALALLSPLDELSDLYLLSAHMVQHLILVLAVAPLLVRAIPIPLGRRLKVHPLAAFLAFNFIFAVSHVPAWYEMTLQHEPVHVLEHLLYLGAGVINWLPVLNPARERRLNSGPSMLYLFAETLPMFAVGSIISLSRVELYAWYLRAAQISPLTRIQDQSVAGLIMWIGGSFFYLAALTVVFFRWANREIAIDQLEQEDRADQVGTAWPARSAGAGFKPTPRPDLRPPHRGPAGQIRNLPQQATINKQ
ncbi:MAG: cytochrome c oxidase assembly protein, partial [Chloroflexota bacterium]|nr:cytochrome c oxidase assembly protein [Chloroflexota bacterium]